MPSPRFLPRRHRAIYYGVNFIGLPRNDQASEYFIDRVTEYNTGLQFYNLIKNQKRRNYCSSVHKLCSVVSS